MFSLGGNQLAYGPDFQLLKDAILYNIRLIFSVTNHVWLCPPTTAATWRFIFRYPYITCLTKISNFIQIIKDMFFIIYKSGVAYTFCESTTSIGIFNCLKLSYLLKSNAMKTRSTQSSIWTYLLKTIFFIFFMYYRLFLHCFNKLLFKTKDKM